MAHKLWLRNERGGKRADLSLKVLRNYTLPGIDLTRSWMVGDTLDDVEAGRRAGARGLLFDSGGETVWRRSPLREPEAVFDNWAALAAHVLDEVATGAAPAGRST